MLVSMHAWITYPSE